MLGQVWLYYLKVAFAVKKQKIPTGVPFVEQHRVMAGEKYSSSIWCQDLNTQPLDHESSALTTRPRWPPDQCLFPS